MTWRWVIFESKLKIAKYNRITNTGSTSTANSRSPGLCTTHAVGQQHWVNAEASWGLAEFISDGPQLYLHSAVQQPWGVHKALLHYYVYIVVYVVGHLGGPCQQDAPLRAGFSEDSPIWCLISWTNRAHQIEWPSSRAQRHQQPYLRAANTFALIQWEPRQTWTGPRRTSTLSSQYHRAQSLGSSTWRS